MSEDKETLDFLGQLERGESEVREEDDSENVEAEREALREMGFPKLKYNHCGHRQGIVEKAGWLDSFGNDVLIP